jgi:hypothetical protein
MNLKELIAGMLSLLVTAGTLVAVSAATTLDQYPGFLVSAGQLNAYVVVGSGGTDPAGLASDIAGAVDIAVRLAELQYSKTTVSVSGAPTVDGITRDISIAGGATQVLTSSGFPPTLRDFHFTGLKVGTVNFKGTDYNYHEEVVVDNNVKLDHTYSASNVNGTQKLTIGTNKQIEYKFVFDSNITGLGTTASPDYANVLKLKIMGQDFVITGVGPDGFKALVGSYGLADATTPVVSGGYSVYVLDGGSGGPGTGWAKIQIKDSGGNVLVTDSLYVGDSKTYTLGSTTYKLKLTAVFASTISNTVSGQLVFGTDVDKSYPNTPDQSPDHRFPGTTDWYVYGSGFGNGVTNNGSIGVVYWPTETQYLKAGDVFKAPNDYFELSFTGWNVDKFATITIEKVTGQSIYDNPTDTTPAGSNLNGFKISSDVKGTIQITSPDWWDKVYVLFNGTNCATTCSVWIGHEYSGKIVKDAFTANILASLPYIQTFTLSYGSAQSVNYLLEFNVTSGPTLSVKLTDSSGNYPVIFDYKFDSLTANPPTFKLGTTANSAEDTDIQSGSDNIGKASQDVVTDTPVIVLSPSSYTGSDKVAFKIPADELKARVAFGKVGAATTVGGVYYTFAGPVVSPVAKLDKELTAADKASKHLIVVGGPCVNSVAAEVLGLVYPACGTDSGLTPDTAKIGVVDDKYASGLKVVLVYGWEAKDTRLAANVLQNYDQATVASKLVGKSSVTVSGTSLATATIS